ncbi:hypothetical protein AB9K34_20415 [Sedimentitalea sp. XS_ASV28]|uniref:hypothetical protein n=1 Tax=Sedimentitalea sp. XS_ASV28 TaxID=3241296 RepID=UPI00351915A3
MFRILTLGRETRTHLALAADLHDRKQSDMRERQGRRRFQQWARDTRYAELIASFAQMDNAAARLGSDDLPDRFLACTAMQDFIGFVDREASANWTADYDTSVADAIFSGFVAEAIAERKAEDTAGND